MPLWLLTAQTIPSESPPSSPDPVPIPVRVVRADDESTARQIAETDDDSIKWRDPAQAVCRELEPEGGAYIIFRGVGV